MKNDIAVKKIRINNQINVLQAIVEHPGVTRSELVPLTNVSLMTISNVVDDLLIKGLVKEEKTVSTIGRAPSKLFFSKDDCAIVGIDLASTTVYNYNVYSMDKQIVAGGFATVSENYAEGLKALCADISLTCAEKGLTVLGVGVSVPGAYDAATDTVTSKLIDSLNGIRLRALIAEQLQVSNVLVGHDVNMAGVAESQYVPADASIFYLYVGDGVGGSYIDGQKVMAGVNAMAGDVGQSLVNIPTYPNTLENVVSTSAVEAHVRSIGLDYGIDEILLRYMAGDTRFSAHVDYVFTVLDVAIYNLLWQYNPNYVIVKSTSAEYQKLIVENANAFLEGKKNVQFSFAVQNLTTKIIPSFISENSALDGLFYDIKTKLISQLIAL